MLRDLLSSYRSLFFARGSRNYRLLYRQQCQGLGHWQQRNWIPADLQLQIQPSSGMRKNIPRNLIHNTLKTPLISNIIVLACLTYMLIYGNIFLPDSILVEHISCFLILVGKVNMSTKPSFQSSYTSHIVLVSCIPCVPNQDCRPYLHMSPHLFLC